MLVEPDQRPGTTGVIVQGPAIECSNFEALFKTSRSMYMCGEFTIEKYLGAAQYTGCGGSQQDDRLSEGNSRAYDYATRSRVRSQIYI